MRPVTPPVRFGVLAFGDSITNGGGELQWGVALQSWAQWLARGLGMPFTNLAVDGARCADVLAEQIPRLEGSTAKPSAAYDVGCLYIGVNDVRSVDWDLPAYEKALNGALEWLGRRCDRVLVCTLPGDLGRPRATERVTQANEAIARAASAHRVLLVDLSRFGARNFVMADQVHPTAFGQIAIAERALAVLAADGLATRLPPRSLIRYETPRRSRLRGDWTYVYRRGKVAVRAHWQRWRAR